MQEACGELLEAAGYRQYEISAWAQPGRECRHNLNYWQYGDFIGIGAGAGLGAGRQGGWDDRFGLRRHRKWQTRGFGLGGGQEQQQSGREQDRDQREPAEDPVTPQAPGERKRWSCPRANHSGCMICRCEAQPVWLIGMSR